MCSSCTPTSTVEVFGKSSPHEQVAIRSYKFLSVDAWSGDDDASRATPFVGLFNNVGFDTWPIFMRAGDDIASLIYPWDNHTTHGTVPRGVKVLTFTEPHFTGDCMAWTNDTNLTKTWVNNNIRSLRVRAVDDVIKCNKATTPSTTPPLVPTTRRPVSTVATPMSGHDDSNDTTDIQQSTTIPPVRLWDQQRFVTSGVNTTTPTSAPHRTTSTVREPFVPPTLDPDDKMPYDIDAPTPR
ncbi:Aste57867_1842 [Aphanomyces stellatus]|uniref:Aste57867_1842 protein n=1 Tax=Aphanomyces stellatus TaxID=120398 RepID=A0A485K9P0_9STRA|nr:hypothetical protein As57867_001840 [Aphanomyces stellatus]VFT79050.1 Aste57867_1842 [Aphanomyces stellatus]